MEKNFYLKSALAAILILLNLACFISCKKEVVDPKPNSFAAPKLDKSILNFGKNGGEQIVKSDIGFIFYSIKINGKNHEIPSSSNKNTVELIDGLKFHKPPREENHYQIESDWFTLTIPIKTVEKKQFRDNTTLIVELKPLAEGKKENKIELELMGHSISTILTINQGENLFRVSEKEAENIASNFFYSLNENTRITKKINIESIQAATYAGTNNNRNSTDTTATNILYSVNLANNEGFFIVSADKRAAPIYAFSNTGNISFSETDDIPPAMIAIIENAYADVLLEIESSDDINESWESTATRGVNPVVKQIGPKSKVFWGQGAPYNKYTFTKKGEKAPVGCTATAAAQALTILRPKAKSFSNYTFKTSWDEMTKAERASSVSALAQEDIARLMAKIGEKIGMDYQVDGSAGSVVKAAQLICKENEKFDYFRAYKHLMPVLNSPEGVTILEAYAHTWKSGWGPWRKRMYSDGHAMLIDGYIKHANGGIFLHVNYGWGGHRGYFLDNNKNWTKDTDKFPYNMTFYNFAKKEVFK